jgi:hypothetical protein
MIFKAEPDRAPEWTPARDFAMEIPAVSLGIIAERKLSRNDKSFFSR